MGFHSAFCITSITFALLRTDANGGCSVEGLSTNLYLICISQNNVIHTSGLYTIYSALMIPCGNIAYVLVDLS